MRKGSGQKFKILVFFVLLVIPWGIFLFFELYRPGWEDIDLRTFDPVLTIYFDNANRVWLGAGRGIKISNGEDWSDFPYELPGYVTTIAGDANDHIWIGSSALNVFDGENLVTYDSDHSQLVINWINDIAFDGEGRAWVAVGGGYIIIDGDNWTSVSKDHSGNVYGERGVSVIAIDPQDRVWLGSEYGIELYDGTEVITYNTKNSGLADDSVSHIAFEDDGRAWIVTGSGLNVFNGENWTLYDPSNSELLTNWITHLAVDPTGRVWVGTNRGINVIDGDTWITFTKDNSGIRENEVRALAIDPSGRAWVSTTGEGQRFVILAPTGDDLTNPEQIPEFVNWIRYHFFSRGTIWLTSIAFIVLFFAITLDVKFAFVGPVGWLLSLPFLVEVGVHQLEFLGLGGLLFIVPNIGAILSLAAAFIYRDHGQRSKLINRAFWVGIGLGTAFIICVLLVLFFVSD